MPGQIVEGQHGSAIFCRETRRGVRGSKGDHAGGAAVEVLMGGMADIFHTWGWLHVETVVDSAASHEERLLGLRGLAGLEFTDRQHLDRLMRLVMFTDRAGEAAVGVGPAVEVGDRAGLRVNGARAGRAGFPP